MVSAQGRCRVTEWRALNPPIPPKPPNRQTSQDRAKSTSERQIAQLKSGELVWRNGATEKCLARRVNDVKEQHRCVRGDAISSTPIEHLDDTKRDWCPGTESNRRHCDFQSHALPTELPGRRCDGDIVAETGERPLQGVALIESENGSVHPIRSAKRRFREPALEPCPELHKAGQVRLRSPLLCGRRHPRSATGCGSSVVEHSIGNGEVESSILSRSTILFRALDLSAHQLLTVPRLKPSVGSHPPDRSKATPDGFRPRCAFPPQ